MQSVAFASLRGSRRWQAAEFQRARCARLERGRLFGIMPGPGRRPPAGGRWPVPGQRTGNGGCQCPARPTRACRAPPACSAGHTGPGKARPPAGATLATALVRTLNRGGLAGRRQARVSAHPHPIDGIFKLQATGRRLGPHRASKGGRRWPLSRPAGQAPSQDVKVTTASRRTVSDYT